MAKKSNSPTMKDVAELVGVSVQTVSAVVNEKPGITIETRARVFNAIEQLGYRPYSIARSLRTRRTHTLALIVPDIANPSFSTIASTAEDVALAFNYSLVIYNTHESVEREENYIRTATERWVDGVLFVAARDQMTSLVSLKSAEIPCVAIDRIPEGYIGPSVTLDNVQAGFIAAEHLISLGHSQIGHISGPLRLNLARERMDGFQKALETHHLRKGIVVNSTGWGCEDGYQAMKDLLASGYHPSAIFGANDRIAIGAMKAAVESGIHVPGDLSVIGLDDIELASFQVPPLTTVRQSFSELATIAMQTLLEILAGKSLAREQVMLEPRLVIRQSTQAYKPKQDV